MNDTIGTPRAGSFDWSPGENEVLDQTRSVSRRSFSLGISTGLIGGLLGCSFQQATVSLKVPTQSYRADQYKSVLRSWTRSKRLNSLEEMDNVLTVTSTYYSAEFRAAYLAKYREDFHLTPPETQAMAAEHRAILEGQHEFYVALYAQTYKYGLLDVEEGAWQMHLVDSRGHALKPERVEHIRRPGVVELSYFPYTNSFRNVFRVTFKKAGEFDAEFSGAKWFGLRFSGAQGTTMLTWQVAPS